MTIRIAALLSLIACPLAAQQTPATAPLSTFAYDTKLPLNARDSLRQRIDGVEVRDLSFDSPKGGRVTGLLYLPGTPGKHAGILVGHGAPGDSRGYATMTLGLAMAKSGAVVIAIDAPFARRQADPINFSSQDSTDQVQLIIDLQRGVDYLIGRGDVDAARLGYIGNSFGGAIGGLFAGVEPRLKAVVLRVADGGWISHFTDPCSDGQVGEAVVTGCLTWSEQLSEAPKDELAKWAAAVLPVEGLRFIGRSKAKLLLQNGEQDPLVPPAKGKRLKAVAPEGTVQEWYPSGHRLPNAALISAIHFFHVELGLRQADAPFEAWLTQRTAAPPPSR